MALSGWSSSNYLTRSSAVGGTRPYMIAAWFYMTSTPTNVNYEAASVGSASNGRNWLTYSGWGGTTAIQAGEADNVDGNWATSGTNVTASQWNFASGAYISATLREVRYNAATMVSDTASRTMGTPNLTRVGIATDGSSPFQNTGAIGWVSVWDLTGFTSGNRDSLHSKLYAGDNPTTVNAESSQPWTGKLIACYRLNTSSDLTDLSGNGNDLTLTGTLSTFSSSPAVDQVVAVPVATISTSPVAPTTMQTVAVPVVAMSVSAVAPSSGSSSTIAIPVVTISASIVAPGVVTGTSLNDTFTEASNTAITAHTADSGGGWTRHPNSNATYTGTIIASTDKLRADQPIGVLSTPFTNLFYAADAPSSADYTVTGLVDWINDGDGLMIGGRCDTANSTAYLIELTSSGWWETAAGPRVRLIKVVNGTTTELGYWDHASLPSAQVKYELILSGTTIKVNVDSTERISVTDSAISAAGKIAVELRARNDSYGPHLDRIYATSSSGTGAQTVAVPVVTISASAVLPAVLYPQTVAVPVATITMAEVAPTVINASAYAIPAVNLILGAGGAIATLVGIPEVTITLAEVAPTGIVAGPAQTRAVPVVTMTTGLAAPSVSATITRAVPVVPLAILPLDVAANGMWNVAIPVVTMNAALAAPSSVLSLTVPVPVATLSIAAALPSGSYARTIPVDTVTIGLTPDVPPTVIGGTLVTKAGLTIINALTGITSLFRTRKLEE